MCLHVQLHMYVTLAYDLPTLQKHSMLVYQCLKIELSSLYQNNFCSDNENAMMLHASNHTKVMQS